MCSTTDETNSSLLDKMRLARGSANSAYITFIDNHRFFSNHVFCFYEGEDGKYYNQKIKSILGENIITIKTGDKKEVIKVWRKIKSDSNYDNIKKCFFVDRDMDEVPNDNNEDLFITPCYSIENLYSTANSLGNILQSEFSCDKYDSDYKKCIDKFNQLQQQFNEEMIEFNALVLLRQRKNLGSGKVSLNNIKTTKMISININEVTKGNKYDEIIGELKSKLNVSQDELAEAIKEIKQTGDFNNLFRGKNQLDFFVNFLNILKQLHKEKIFFETSHNCVTINITKNRLSELSQYADFPTCLQLFLEKHKITA